MVVITFLASVVIPLLLPSFMVRLTLVIMLVIQQQTYHMYSLPFILTVSVGIK